MNKIDFIRRNQCERSQILLIAEEAAELAQAALKYVRVVYTNDCPSPVNEKEAMENLKEEIADTYNAIRVFNKSDCWKNDIEQIADIKLDRYIDRLTRK